MRGKHNRLIFMGPMVAVGLACNGVTTATKMHVARMEETLEHPHAHLTDMADNAMMHDMSLADVHFVPHTTELSGTGTARLDRMAVVLNAYGGTVRYETLSTDNAMVEQRLNHVREYLAMTGCDMQKVKVQTMISGGRGMEASRAIAVLKKGTAVKTGGQGSSSSAPGVASAAPMGEQKNP